MLMLHLALAYVADVVESKQPDAESRSPSLVIEAEEPAQNEKETAKNEARNVASLAADPDVLLGKRRTRSLMHLYSDLEMI